MTCGGTERAAVLRLGATARLDCEPDRTLSEEQSVDQASAAVTATERYVQDSPWRAVGIVAGVSCVVGLAAGLYMGRTSRSS